MGGRGSGRRAGFGMLTAKTNDYHSIDLAWMRREKMLRPGLSGTIRWSRGRHETGSIQYLVEPDGLVLHYRTQPHNGEWQSVTDRIPFVRTATRFGGHRLWFRCLSCSARCRIVYGGTYFRCRRCYGLKYETQYEPSFSRAATRALKIRERLGCRAGLDAPTPMKPKGMHWKTYGRLEAELERLDRRWAAGVAAKWSFLGQRD